MMNPLTMMPSTLIPAYPPLINYPKHGQEASDNPTVLDLRKRLSTPNYPHDYKYAMPNYPSAENPCTSPRSETSSDLDTSNQGRATSPCFKRDRPFKAYLKDPLVSALMGTTAQYMVDKESTEAYSEFRKKMLKKVHASYNTTINTNMRRMQNTQNDDPTYLEKRRKNNVAAKRSRDARKAKEDEIAIRCAFLEQQNVQLRIQLAAIEKERENLQSLIFH